MGRPKNKKITISYYYIGNLLLSISRELLRAPSEVGTWQGSGNRSLKRWTD